MISPWFLSGLLLASTLTSVNMWYGVGVVAIGLMVMATGVGGEEAKEFVIGALLGLVEVYQRQDRWEEAIACLERLQSLEPDDVVVKLSLAELLLQARPDHEDVCRMVVGLAEGIDNETPVHTALLLYKAKALHGLGLLDAARETLTMALRRTKGRSVELLRAVRYERALVYAELGQHRRARSEFEKLYAQAPDYEDVAARLGL